MEYREFATLTDDEVRQLAKEIFNPKKITCIKRNKKRQEIIFKSYSEWKTTDDDGNIEVLDIADEIIIRNPFDYMDSIEAPFTLDRDDYIKLKQFCFAKGVIPWWQKENPYMQVSKEGKTR